MKQVSFLSHVIMKLGMSMDSSKIQDTLSQNALTSVTDICSPLGLAGYYRGFTEGFSKTTKPKKLLERDKKFKWTPTMKLNFRN
jgi:hypothetical protein